MKLTWDDTGKRLWETGVEQGTLFVRNALGLYPTGVAWNGLTAVTESPSGAESNKLYADNRVYANIMSAEELSGTIEAYMWPTEFNSCDGTASPYPGVYVGQQSRDTFGFVYKTKIGNDVSEDLGYKLHLWYGCKASPSEKAYNTVNESPELTTFSWEVSAEKIEVPGLKPAASLTIASTEVDAAKLAALEAVLFGTAGVDARLPLPAEVFTLIGTVLTDAMPVMPAYVQGTHTITIPTTTGIDYQIDGVTKVAGAVVITKDTTVIAVPKATFRIKPGWDDDFFYAF